MKEHLHRSIASHEKSLENDKLKWQEFESTANTRLASALADLKDLQERSHGHGGDLASLREAHPNTLDLGTCLPLTLTLTPTPFTTAFKPRTLPFVVEQLQHEMRELP